jgi:phage gpG-like protein
MNGDVFDPQAVQDALAEQAASFASELEARIQQKLTGEVLQVRSGALAASILSSVDSNESGTSISVSSTCVPYAAIQEYGGKTTAHEIIATNAKALAFRLGGDLVFAKHVNHPGSNIPARSYLASSLADMQDEIELGFKQAILDALGPA